MKKALIICLAVAVAMMFMLTVTAAPTAVGAEKCKMCHKVQYESWAKSKHATGTDKATCETCHGNGADYMKMAVMKDPAKAKEAGLIAKPEKASCTAKCHKAAEFKDEMLGKVHDKKKKS